MKKDMQSAVVKFQGGFYRVTSHRGGKVNLSGVCGGRIYYKGIPEAEVVEAYEEFYKSLLIDWTTLSATSAYMGPSKKV
jgi:hypothetical protein